MKRQYIIVTLFFLTLMGINCSYGDDIETILQDLINAEIKYQIEQMKNSSLKELINDVPEYTINLTAVKEIKSNDNASKGGSVSSSKKAISLPFPSEKKFYYMKPEKPGSISIKNLIEYSPELSIFLENYKPKNLTELINSLSDYNVAVTPGNGFIPKDTQDQKALTNDQIAFMTKHVNIFIEKGIFDYYYWDNNYFGKIIIGNFRNNSQCTIKSLMSTTIDLGKALETNLDYIKKLQTITKKIDTNQLDEQKTKNLNTLVDKLNEWGSACNRVTIVYELARLRSTVIHELCHPLTWYYSGIVQQEKYYEGVNVLISCAYELEKGYWSNDKVYLSRYNGDQTYIGYYDEVKKMLGYEKGYEKPKVPTFTDLKRLDYKTRNITSSAEDTLATALGLIKIYSSKTEDQKTALREILKQYINADTAEDRKAYVDAILNGINIEGNFFLVYKEVVVTEGTKKNPYKNSFIIADSNSNVNGIFSCEINTDNNIFRIIVKDGKKNLEVFGTEFDTEEELYYKDLQNYKKLNIQTQAATKESSEQTTQITYGLQNTITFKRKQ